jgi:hypothetical protein
VLSVRFEIADLPEEAPVRVKEGRGRLTYELHQGLFLPEGVAALNSAAAQVIAGGQWFQLWRGEVVSLCSPELRRLPYAGVYRGSLVQEGARRS